MISLVVAVARDGAIGRAGDLPWHAPEDLAHFKAVTMGHTLVVGRRTWDSIGRVLPGRRFVVVSRAALDDLPDGADAAASPADALEVARRTDPDPIVAGGAVIYDALLPEVDRIHRTSIDIEVPDADAWFPVLDPAEWEVTSSRPGDDPRLLFEVLDRV